MFAPGPRKTKASTPSSRIVPQPILRPSSIGSSPTSNPPMPPPPPPPKPPPPRPRSDRKSVGSGKSVSVRVHLGGRRTIKKKITKTHRQTQTITINIRTHHNFKEKK